MNNTLDRFRAFALSMICLVCAFYSRQASAMTIKVTGQSIDGKQIIIASGLIMEHDSIPRLSTPVASAVRSAEPAFQPHQPALLYITSPGSFNNAEAELANSIASFAAEVKENSGTNLEVVFGEFCGSGCILLAAHVNILAGDGVLDASILPGTKFGFHPDHWNGKRDENRTAAEIQQLKTLGVSDEWLSQHKSYFSQTLITDKPVVVRMDSDEMREAGFVNNMKIRRHVFKIKWVDR